ncbi:MAG: DNA-3-methyladenine glycosylase [Actinobacteria bacterium]|nr:DNA-3-methyladenine glycosylase [Actinomycetota bacterium]
MDRNRVLSSDAFKLVENYSILGKPIELTFFARHTEEVAIDLLGKILVKKERDGYLAARIVETEAYFGPGDPASHAHRGPTKRSKVMFEEPGTIYVYLCYGMHFMLNVVTEKKGIAGAVLIRAAEPLAGIDLMMQRRKTKSLDLLLSGPARLTQAFDINLRYNAKLANIQNGIFFIQDAYFPVRIVRSRRIGVPLIDGDNFRFYDADSKSVSKR